MEIMTTAEYRAQFPQHAKLDDDERNAAGQPDAYALRSREILDRLRNQTSPVTAKAADPEPATEPEHRLDRLMREYKD